MINKKTVGNFSDAVCASHLLFDVISFGVVMYTYNKSLGLEVIIN